MSAAPRRTVALPPPLPSSPDASVPSGGHARIPVRRACAAFANVLGRVGVPLGEIRLCDATDDVVGSRGRAELAAEAESAAAWAASARGGAMPEPHRAAVAKAWTAAALALLRERLTVYELREAEPAALNAALCESEETKVRVVYSPDPDPARAGEAVAGAAGPLLEADEDEFGDCGGGASECGGASEGDGARRGGVACDGGGGSDCEGTEAQAAAAAHVAAAAKCAAAPERAAAPKRAAAPPKRVAAAALAASLPSPKRRKVKPLFGGTARAATAVDKARRSLHAATRAASYIESESLRKAVVAAARDAREHEAAAKTRPLRKAMARAARMRRRMLAPYEAALTEAVAEAEEAEREKQERVQAAQARVAIRAAAAEKKATENGTQTQSVAGAGRAAEHKEPARQGLQRVVRDRQDKKNVEVRAKGAGVARRTGKVGGGGQGEGRGLATGGRGSVRDGRCGAQRGGLSRGLC